MDKQGLFNDEKHYGYHCIECKEDWESPELAEDPPCPKCGLITIRSIIIKGFWQRNWQIYRTKWLIWKADHFPRWLGGGWYTMEEVKWMFDERS